MHDERPVKMTSDQAMTLSFSPFFLSQLENDEGGGFKLAPKPNTKLITRGLAASATVDGATTAGGDANNSEAPEIDSRKFVQRVKTLLMEM